LKKFKKSLDQYFTLVEELHTSGHIKVEAMVIDYNFKTNDYDFYFICEDKKVINFRKIKNEEEKKNEHE
jgi:hypothetical protein